MKKGLNKKTDQRKMINIYRQNLKLSRNVTSLIMPSEYFKASV